MAFVQKRHNNNNDLELFALKHAYITKEFSALHKS